MPAKYTEYQIIAPTGNGMVDFFKFHNMLISILYAVAISQVMISALGCLLACAYVIRILGSPTRAVKNDEDDKIIRERNEQLKLKTNVW